MDIAQVNQPTASGAAGSTAAASAQINSDFEVFLQMLTAQMQYQDPLNPIDSTDYATQLATFSGVEQAVLTNDLLQSLTTQLATGGLVDMAALVGKEVRSTAPVAFQGQPMTLYPTQIVAADTTELVVRDAAGNEVQRTPVVIGADGLQWAGVAQDGTPFPPGSYQFEIAAISNDVVVAQTPVETYSTVTEVRLEGSTTMLVLAGGGTVPSDQVTALRQPR